MKTDTVVAGTLLLGIFLFGRGEVRKFEKQAARDIASKLQGPEVKVEVSTRFNGIFGALDGDLRRVAIKASDFATEELPLFTEPSFSKRGKVRELHLSLQRFTLRGLRVEKLEATIPNCRFDLGLALKKRQIRLSQSGVGLGTVRLQETDLEAFVLRKFREIKTVKVQIQGGQIVVEGYGEFLMVRTNFRVEAKLSPQDGTQLLLTEAAITFDGKKADDLSRKVLLDTLNPVVDLRSDLGLYDAVAVEKIELREGFLEASGRTKIPERPLPDQQVKPVHAGNPYGERTFSGIPATRRAS